MECIGPEHPLRRLFSGLVEQAFFSEVGVCDPALTDYVSELLVSFVHVDRLCMLQNAADKRLEQVAAMLAVMADEVPPTAQERDRLMHRHIGDYTLFWAGVYPEHLKLARRNQADVLLDFVSQGKRSYAIVSELASNEDRPPARIFRQLSEDFEYCLYGLNLVRKGWEDAGRPSAGHSGEILY